MDFYDEWLRSDLWTFKAAAMLFNDWDPKYAKDVGFKYYESDQMDDWKKPILKTYKLFLLTSWGDWDTGAQARRATHRDIFFQIALDKAIPFSDTLKLRYVQYTEEIKKNKDIPFHNKNLANNYLRTLENTVNDLANKYPQWKEMVGIVKKTDNLLDWVYQETKADTREAKVIIKALAEHYPELK